MARSKSRNRGKSKSSKRTEDLEALRLINVNAAGIDIGATAHHVAVPADRDDEPVRRFGSFTEDLHQLADWLAGCGIQTVAMESTGVYWICVYQILEQRGFEVKLVNPRHLKHVPGRKTDMVDCQWIQQLHTYGLLAGSFRPDDQICVLRSYLRQRQMLVEYAANHIQHIQKALTQMNVKLQHVIRDVTGRTGMDIIQAIVEGERDPQVLARYRQKGCKNDEATIAASLRGDWREEHLFELKQAVELYEFYQKKLADCDQRIEAHLKTFEDHSQDQEALNPKGRTKPKGNAPQFDVPGQLYRITGSDLTGIDGIDSHTALKIISEIGLDMTRWSTSKQFASWLGLCPGSKISGGKTLSTRSKACANRAAAAFRLAAHGLHNSKSALGAYLRRMKARLGPAKAITATAHKLARLVYSILRHGHQYVDPGQDYYEQQHRSRVVNNLTRRAKEIGYRLVATEDNETTSTPVDLLAHGV